MLVIVLFITTLFLAYSNGANDNFKGVATLYGSGVLTYRSAILIAAFMTFLGSICAVFVASGLVSSFSGKGLVPLEVAGTINFLIASGLGAGCTVLWAARLGFPVSTTHSLIGGLLGAGVMAVGSEVNFAQLGGAFFLPLFLSPLAAIVLGLVAYWVFSHSRKILGINKTSFTPNAEQDRLSPTRVEDYTESGNLAYANTPTPPGPIALAADGHAACVERYTSKVWGVPVQKALDTAHVFSAAAVSFARGLNDTPKIGGLLVAAHVLDIRFGLVAIAIGMALGGLFSSRKVAETMSKEITSINHGQGFSANLVTSFLVIVASNFGVPVSTTHVSVGSLLGISLLSRQQNNQVVRKILLSWLVTLPVAMLFGSVAFWFFSKL